MSSPVKYADLGKAAKDLLKKKFDLKNTLKVTRTTADGLKVETVATSKDSLSGKVTGTFKEKGFGEVEFSADTSSVFNGKLKLTSLVEGATVTLKTQVAKVFSTTAEVLYKAPSVTGSVAATLTENGKVYDKSFVASVVFGYEDFTAGAQVKSVAPKEGDEAEAGPAFAYEGAISYVAKDSVITGTANGTGDLGVSFFHKVCPGYKAATTFQYPSKVLTLASEFALDKDTIAKGSVSTKGIVKSAVEHTLSNPALKINLAAEATTTNGFDITTTKTGLGLTLG